MSDSNVRPFVLSWYIRAPIIAILLGYMVPVSIMDLIEYWFPPPPVWISTNHIGSYGPPMPTADVDPAVIGALRGVWEVREFWIAGLPFQSEKVKVPWNRPGRQFLFIDENSFHFVNYDRHPKKLWALDDDRYPVFEPAGPGTIDLYPSGREIWSKNWDQFQNTGHPVRWKLDGDRMILASLNYNRIDKPKVRPEITDTPGTELWYVLTRVDRTVEKLPVFDIVPTSLPSSFEPVSPPMLTEEFDAKRNAERNMRSDHPGFSSGTLSSKSDLDVLPESLRNSIETAFDKPPISPEPKPPSD